MQDIIKNILTRQEDENTKIISLLATSDVHGFYMPWDYSLDMKTDRGGLTRVSSVVKQIREENPNTMLIDCGDLIQGNSMDVFLNRDKFPATEVVNYMGYEILNMGNHEFNFGMETLINIISNYKGVPMMGNLYKENGYRALNGYYIKHFGKIKIGFISLNTPMVRHFEEKRGNLKGYQVTDADIELEKLLEEIPEVDALIGVFHMGDTNENNIANTGTMDLLYNVKRAERIDAVIGGHMHRIIHGKKINQAVFTQPGKGGEGLIRIDLEFEKADKDYSLKSVHSEVILIDSTIESDPDLEKILYPYHRELRTYANDIIGFLTEDLSESDDIPGVPQVRVAQTKLSDFFLDVMLHYSGADVVATQIDNPYPLMRKGEVRRKHIYNSYQYNGGDINNYRVTGRDLKDYMEWSAGFYNQSVQGDVTISFDDKRSSFKYSTLDIFGNIKYLVDLTKPVGNRIVKLTYMDERPIAYEDQIILGINKYRMDFLTSDEGPLHDREFELLWSSMLDKSLGVRGTIRNLSMKYFKELEANTYAPKKEERWKIKTAYVVPELKDITVELLKKGMISPPLTEYDAVDNTKSMNIYKELTDGEYEHIINRYPKCADYWKEKPRLIDVLYKFRKQVEE